MAIFPLHTTTIITKDVLINSPFKAGMALIIDSNGRAVKADSQQLVFNTSFQKYGKFLGFSASDHDLSGNTIILPDNKGSNYLDINNRFIKNENTEYVVPKRGLLDLQDTAVSNFYNSSDISTISRRGIGVYNTPGDYFVTDQFNPVLHGDYGFDGLDIQTINPGDLLTFGGGINAGKLVKVNVNSIGPDILVVGQVSRYNSSTGLLYFRQVNYNVVMGNNYQVALDAGNINSFTTGTTAVNMANTLQNSSLLNGVLYSQLNNGTFFLDGTNDKIQNTSYTVTIPVSMEVWYKWPGVNIYNEFFGFGNPNSNGLHLISGTNGDGCGNGPYHSVTTGGISCAALGTPGLLTQSANIFYHYVITYDASTLKLYVNGVLITSASVGANSPAAGYASDAGGYYGQMNIYNKVLSPTEILTNYNMHKSRYGL
jgi:hypothetical protein